MDSATLGRLAEQYPWSSWVVWDDSFPDDDCVEECPERLFEFVQNHAEMLTGETVFVGLNRSDDLPAPFSNFHAPTRTHYDYRLKEFVQDGGLRRLHGAYMTDLVDEVDADSHNVDATDEDVAVLLEQLQLLGADEYHLICFGNDPFDALVEYFDVDVSAHPPELRCATVALDGLMLHLYRVWFYGLYGANQDKVAVLERQLQTLNEQVV
ncbi:hypothetical protein [Haloplanus aerogenes]|uniref:Uncharacterized protein n=1 Tax=Haloplanus aerogenes TaxID=660522 RepID=A0A3M0D0Q0_9EURY|nr:hypothetical protein [Haloplanus aerogenes]RMB13950.1 hypothetical protein ATH50_2394 [Haloplanus aerogenes]